MPIASSPDFSAQRETLNQILNLTPASREPLPPLVEETSWLEEAVKKISHFLGDLLRALFPRSSGMDLSGIIRPIIYLAIAALAIWIIVAIAKALEKKGARGVRIKVDGPLFSAGGSNDVAGLVQEALRKGDLALAGRLRWRLFLMRTGRADAATPMEVSGPSQDVSSWYRLMFAAGAGKNVYDEFERHLSALEGRAPGGAS